MFKFNCNTLGWKAVPFISEPLVNSSFILIFFCFFENC